jgi:hypothetical protein
MAKVLGYNGSTRVRGSTCLARSIMARRTPTRTRLLIANVSAPNPNREAVSSNSVAVASTAAVRGDDVATGQVRS